MFRYVKSDNMGTPAMEAMPVKNGEVYVCGEALTVSGGAVTKASGTTRPTYICGEEKTGVTGDTIAVTRVHPYQVWEAPLSAAGTSLVPGAKVTINTDGLKLTATTTDGVAEITQILGTAVGDKIRVRF